MRAHRGWERAEALGWSTGGEDTPKWLWRGAEAAWGGEWHKRHPEVALEGAD